MPLLCLGFSWDKGHYRVSLKTATFPRNTVVFSPPSASSETSRSPSETGKAHLWMRRRKMPLSLELPGEVLLAEPNTVPSPQEWLLDFLVPFCLGWRDWSLFFSFFFFRSRTLKYSFLRKKHLSNSPWSLGGCHRNLWHHWETGPALFRCYPCMACNARLLPASRLYDYKKLCKAKQLLLNGCRSAKWMQSGSCHSKASRCLSAGSKKLSVSRRSIPNIPNYLQAWLLQRSTIPHSHHFVLIMRVYKKRAHLLKSHSSMPFNRTGHLLFCRIINMSNFIVAAKHASPHCNIEVSKWRRKGKERWEEGAPSDRVPVLQFDESVYSWSIDAKHTKSGEDPDFKDIGLEMTSNFFFVQLYRYKIFFVILFASALSYCCSTFWI